MLTTAPLHNQTRHPSGMCLAAAGPRAATVITRADGGFIVEPARPDDSLVALLCAADASLGRPVEKIGRLLAGIVKQLFNFGPVIAGAAPLATSRQAEDNSSHTATSVPPADTATARARRAADTVRIRHLDHAGAAWNLTSERNSPVTANLRKSLHDAIDEGPETARVIARALGETERIVVVPPDSPRGKRLSELALFDARQRVLFTGHMFAGTQHAGALVRWAHMVISEDGNLLPEVAAKDRAACAKRLEVLTRQALDCLVEAVPAQCIEADRHARQLGTRPIYLRAAGVPRFMTVYTLNRKGTLSIEFAVEISGAIARLTPIKLRHDENAYRPVTAREARIINLYRMTADAAAEIEAPGTMPIPTFLPWSLINATCPPVATVLKHEATSTSPTRTAVRNEL